jgi:pyrroline-5-carboxylate reductase
MVISDPVAAAVAAAQAAVPGVRAAASNVEAARGAEVVLLCVKPYGIVSLVESLKDLPSTLLISIAAGITLPAMEAVAGNHRVVRVMPNTPALVGKGAAAYAPGTKATEADCLLTEKLLSAVGTVTRVAEKLLNAVTGLSGSGPAYIYTVIEALADGGVMEGLTKDQALQLAAQTVAGAAEMVLQTGLHPAVLRDQVTSPGGTTIAALATLEAKGLRSALIEAVRTATKRAHELGKD